MSSFLYGRMQGRGNSKELTCSGVKDEPIRSQLETRNAAIRITLRANGSAEVEVGRKTSDKARPDRWKTHSTIDIDGAALT